MGWWVHFHLHRCLCEKWVILQWKVSSKWNIKISANVEIPLLYHTLLSQHFEDRWVPNSWDIIKCQKSEHQSHPCSCLILILKILIFSRFVKISHMSWKVTVTKHVNPFRLVIQAVHTKYMSCNRCSPNYNVIPASEAKFQLDLHKISFKSSCICTKCWDLKGEFWHTDFECWITSRPSYYQHSPSG